MWNYILKTTNKVLKSVKTVQMIAFNNQTNKITYESFELERICDVFNNSF